MLDRPYVHTYELLACQQIPELARKGVATASLTFCVRGARPPGNSPGHGCWVIFKDLEIRTCVCSNCGAAVVWCGDRVSRASRAKKSIGNPTPVVCIYSIWTILRVSRRGCGG